VAVSCVGKVGGALCELVVEDGGRLTVADLDSGVVASLANRLSAKAVGCNEIHGVECDIYAPCALGGALNAATVPELRCTAVVGAANNQLASPEIAEELSHRDIAYVPDYVANAGGIINIAYERGGYDATAAHEHVGRIFDAVAGLFEEASRSGDTLEAIADRTAGARIEKARASA
ncbi:MAG: leucine dehydrogenase, partial [Acidimicrobiales bacterium]